MGDLPVEKRVAGKRVWTKGAEDAVVCAGFGHGIRRNGKLGSLGQEAKRLTWASSPRSSSTQALSSEAETFTRMTSAKLPGATRNGIALPYCCVWSRSGILSIPPLLPA